MPANEGSTRSPHVTSTYASASSWSLMVSPSLYGPYGEFAPSTRGSSDSTFMMSWMAVSTSIATVLSTSTSYSSLPCPIFSSTDADACLKDPSGVRKDPAPPPWLEESSRLALRIAKDPAPPPWLEESSRLALRIKKDPEPPPWLEESSRLALRSAMRLALRSSLSFFASWFIMIEKCASVCCFLKMPGFLRMCICGRAALFLRKQPASTIRLRSWSHGACAGGRLHQWSTKEEMADHYDQHAIKSSQVRSSQVRSGQVRSGHARSGQVVTHRKRVGVPASRKKVVVPLQRAQRN